MPLEDGCGAEAKYGRVWADGKAFLPGEPVFIIRGKDKAAISAIERYIQAVQLAYAMEARQPPEGFVAGVNAAVRAVKEWQLSNFQHVKLPD